MRPQITDLATNIAADTSLLEGVRLELVSVDKHDLDRNQLNPSISVLIDGRRHILLESFEPSDSCTWSQQIVDVLDQLQDVIVRYLWVPWPQCPKHSHVLVPIVEALEPEWQCPDDARLVISLGSLGNP
jgi:hypothetical protein